MLYNVVVNDWGETTYVPTVLGNVLLVAVIIALLGIAVCFAGKRSTETTKKLSAKQLAFCGSITLLSMLMIALPGYWFGLGAGIMTGVAYGVLQLLIDPYVLYPMQLVVDYLLAFGALGLSGLFMNAKNGLIKGYLAGVVGRYVFAVISGWIFFGAYAWEGWNPLPYSLVYNAIYIFAEAAVTVVILCIPPVNGSRIGTIFHNLLDTSLNIPYHFSIDEIGFKGRCPFAE